MDFKDSINQLAERILKDKKLVQTKFIIYSTLFLLLSSTNSFSQSTVTLRRSFIDSFMNKITISSQFNVWYSLHDPHAATDDADIHVSGYDNKIGMPTVAEVMNAKDQRETIDMFVQHEGQGHSDNPKISITGVWRIWPEHMGHSGTVFFQGMTLPLSTIQHKKTNPDHVFEIHPASVAEGIEVTNSIHNIEGYTPYEVRSVFDRIRERDFTISSTAKTISFTTTQVGYNYIDLWIRIDSIAEVEDGAFAYCRVFDSDFEAGDNVNSKTVSTRTRVAFVKNSECFQQLLQSQLGDFMHILGTPRINLANISWREWISDERPEVLTWRMPVEIIAAGLIE